MIYHKAAVHSVYLEGGGTWEREQNPHVTPQAVSSVPVLYLGQTRPFGLSRGLELLCDCMFGIGDVTLRCGVTKLFVAPLVLVCYSHASVAC